jgi:hypothetical protein
LQTSNPNAPKFIVTFTHHPWIFPRNLPQILHPPAGYVRSDTIFRIAIQNCSSCTYAIPVNCSMADDTPASRGVAQALDLGELRKVLLSNSTKQRTSELNQLHDKLVSQGR